MAIGKIRNIGGTVSKFPTWDGTVIQAYSSELNTWAYASSPTSYDLTKVSSVKITFTSRCYFRNYSDGSGDYYDAYYGQVGVSSGNSGGITYNKQVNYWAGSKTYGWYETTTTQTIDVSSLVGNYYIRSGAAPADNTHKDNYQNYAYTTITSVEFIK